MPPKQQSKADVAKKQKVVEDKTFGLKNKNKSKNVQKYVQSLKQSVQPKPDAKVNASKQKKEEEKKREKELSDLFKVAVSQPKVPPGVDPKSIVCEFFKAGQCGKGFKCKFSHDLNVQRKGEKIDLYSDKRDEETMDDWDLEMLEKVVESKKNEYNQNKPTDIVCKYFLEAVEKKQYGWFWTCPNGEKECHYRHALPPGYILKSQMKALLEEESQKISIEEEIENQRRQTKTTTPLNGDLFYEWKKKKTDQKEAELAAKRAERAKNDRMSGRELFLSDASLFVDDAEAYEKYHREDKEDQPKEMQMEDYLYQKDLYLQLGGKAKKLTSMKDEEWDLLDKKALGTIQLCLAASVVFNISKEKTTKDVMKALAKLYEKPLASNKAEKSLSTSVAETSTSGVTAEEEEQILAEDDDELDLDELDELEASIAKASLETNDNGANSIKIG